MQDDTTSQDQSVSFILHDFCYLQALVTFYYCQIICLCQARLLSSAGPRLFSLGSTEKIFRSLAAVSPVRLLDYSSASMHPNVGAREPLRRIVLFLTNLFHHDNEYESVL